MVPDLESKISTLSDENNELKKKLQKEAESKKKLEGKVIRRNQKILKLEEEKKALEEKDQELSEQLHVVDAELHQAKQEIELLQKTIARRDATIRTTKEVVSGVIAKQEADTESQTLNMVMKLSEAEQTAVVKDTEVKILKDMMATIIWWIKIISLLVLDFE